MKILNASIIDKHSIFNIYSLMTWISLGELFTGAKYEVIRNQFSIIQKWLLIRISFTQISLLFNTVKWPSLNKQKAIDTKNYL